jgi:hypothetical protein
MDTTTDAMLHHDIIDMDGPAKSPEWEVIL